MVGKKSTKLAPTYDFSVFNDYNQVATGSDSDQAMCYFIVTCCSMAWSLLTIAMTVLITMSILSADWLIAGQETATNRSLETGAHSRTIGIFNSCAQLRANCSVYVTGFDMPSDEFPDAWKTSLILFAVALLLLAFTNVTAVISPCVQSIMKKSIFTVSGLIQSVAALFLVIGQVLYPAGWSANRVKEMCGEKAGPFLIDQCTIGWAYYCCMAGTVLVFLCALLSIQAENATSSDKVERKIVKGRQIICVI